MMLDLARVVLCAATLGAMALNAPLNAQAQPVVGAKSLSAAHGVILAGRECIAWRGSKCVRWAECGATVC